ncbi:MAG: Glyoxalase/bleomycin resistance protein/dioxygenase [Gemmatimonadetes bacterium]|jgi:catechol 2,3-dioxygenase|nr:Glyoxalase/bleomycin resistance protein/dioxygenase [Gemmatimonadota bacterium]
MTTTLGIPAPTYRLPAGTHTGVVRLQVADLDRSLAYYQDVIGLHVLQNEHRVALLGVRGGPALVELHEHLGAVPAPLQRRLGLYHFAILLPDRASLGRFITHLAARGERVGASDHLVSEALYLRDPDGLGIEVYVDRPAASWQSRDGEIRMDTSPLDVEDVVRVAHGAPWTGVPSGTVIGHVHLHVGDLAEGERFFHAALGLDKVVWSYPGALFLSAGGYHHHLGTNTWAGGSPRPRAGDARLLEWTLVLPSAEDVERASASLRDAGHEVVDGRVVDPWGTTLRIVHESPVERLQPDSPSLHR